MAENNPYSRKIKIPKFEPSEENVELEDCIDVTRYLELVREINADLKEGKISKEEATFLKLCATRWIKFHYGKVAQWFATKASPAMQRHLERSTMVLIDVEKAFENAIIDGREYFDKVLKRYVTEHSIDYYSHIDLEKANMVDEESLKKLKENPNPPEPNPDPRAGKGKKTKGGMKVVQHTAKKKR